MTDTVYPVRLQLIKLVLRMLGSLERLKIKQVNMDFTPVTFIQTVAWASKPAHPASRIVTKNKFTPSHSI